MPALRLAAGVRGALLKCVPHMLHSWTLCMHSSVSAIGGFCILRSLYTSSHGDGPVTAEDIPSTHLVRRLGGTPVKITIGIVAGPGEGSPHRR